MRQDNILAKMPDRLDYFLAATAVVQDYCVQLHKQVMMRQRPPNFSFTVEIPDDSFLFLWQLFPRMDYVMRGEMESFPRGDWSCVLDFSDIDRVVRVASTPRKHITEAWGIMFGASPRMVPELGPLAFESVVPTVDILIDERVPVKDTMIEYMSLNFPHAKVVVRQMDARPSTVFSLLADAKFYVGVRDGASYMAATMLKPTLEFYDTDLPAWFMDKPHINYNMLYGTVFDPSMVWAIFEEMYCHAAGEPDDFIPDSFQFAGGV